MVGMDSCAQRPVTELSGGQQQRVALARAMVARPGLLLFDEPLSNLDAKLRRTMRREIRGGCTTATGGTSIYVTHDQEEAITLSDRVVVMRGGVDPAGRDAEGDLHQARQPVRRRFHRLREPADRHGQRGTRRLDRSEAHVGSRPGVDVQGHHSRARHRGRAGGPGRRARDRLAGLAGRGAGRRDSRRDPLPHLRGRARRVPRRGGPAHRSWYARPRRGPPGACWRPAATRGCASPSMPPFSLTTTTRNGHPRPPSDRRVCPTPAT